MLRTVVRTMVFLVGTLWVLICAGTQQSWPVIVVPVFLLVWAARDRYSPEVSEADLDSAMRYLEVKLIQLEERLSVLEEDEAAGPHAN